MYHILVVDDDASTREYLSEALRLCGHLPASCASAEVAVTMMPDVDAVICDGLYGDWKDVATEAKRLGKPCVIYTGGDEIVEMAWFHDIPAVLKPAPIETILDALTGARCVTVER